eukprot:Nk52_evm93s352 gene=Nk52_evmTU93s352
MGLLVDGSPLEWAEARKYADHVRKHGIEQFLAIYSKVKNNNNDCLKWGDEVEYYVVVFDDEKKTCRVNLRVHDLLEELSKEEREATEGQKLDVLWRPEYGRFMIEGTPGGPYAGQLEDFLEVEENMKLRRKLVNSLLKPNESAISMTNFPRLGSPDFTEPPFTPYGTAAKSLFIPDEAINAHPRFPTLTQCIRERRGSKVAINMPIYHDKNTGKEWKEDLASYVKDLDAKLHAEGKLKADESVDTEYETARKIDHIYMDAMCFGMGCCCLQTTFQGCNIDEARYLYDQLAVISPVLLALTASSPIYRGYMSDIDCRWNVIAGSVDDRSPSERGEASSSSGPSKYVIDKSRYDSIDSYLSNNDHYKDKYDDINLVIDEEIFSKLEKNGIDRKLARHVAHLFIRDPLVVYKETLDQDDQNESDHFENIQSTNWQTMRFKPPPPNSKIGWRVEFRCMEVQPTDFENAAFIVFIVLLTRVILSFNLNFYIPLSKVDDNLHRAQKRDAVNREAFYMRKQVYRKDDNNEMRRNSALFNDDANGSNSTDGNNNSEDEDANEMMSVDTILNGKDGTFPGLIPLMNAYLNILDVEIGTRCKIGKYLEFISKRASGELLSTASWIRKFVDEHPSYKHDSVISEEINYDLVRAIADLGNGKRVAPEMVGKCR